MFGSRSENIEKIINQNYRKKLLLLIDLMILQLLISIMEWNDIKIIKNINNFLLNRITPDFTFLNVVNKKNLILRLNKRKNKNRYDNFNYKFYDKVQKGFLKIVKKKKYMIVDSNKPLSYNKLQIIKKIDQLIK